MRLTFAIFAILAFLALVAAGCGVVRDGSPGNSGNAPGHNKH